MKGQLKIESMFAFIALDTDGTEGVVAYMEDGMWRPMVGADLERVESIRPYAELAAKKGGIPVTLVHFTHREEIEVIKP